MKRIIAFLLALVLLMGAFPAFRVSADEMETVIAETTEPVVEETTEPAVEETTEPVVEETTEPVAEETTEPVVEETTEPVAEETTEPVAEETTEPASVTIQKDTVSTPANDSIAPQDEFGVVPGPDDGGLDFIPEGLVYEINGSEVTITDYTGSATEVIIPATIDGYPVTAIGSNAFDGCYRLTNITIPDGVISIGESAFFSCLQLTSITIPASVTTIGDCAFRACDHLTGIWVDANNKFYSSDSNGVLFNKTKTQLIAVPVLTSLYTIPDSVTTIADFAFVGCNLTSITIGDNVTSIGSNAFNSCEQLTSVTIGNGITHISEQAFVFCMALTNVTIGNGVTSIGNGAFYWCSRITDVYYKGTEAQWNAISIAKDNQYLTNATLHVVEVAAITKQPKSVCVEEGNTAKVTVKATGEGLSYKWYYKKPGASKFYASSSFTKGTYYVKDMDASKSGWQAYCIITDAYGNSVQTNTVTLNVPVTITQQPVSVGVENGTKATVTVKAVGKDLTYAWYYKKAGAKSFYLSTTKTSTYSITMSDSNDGRQVYCIISDSYGNSEQTNTVTLDQAVTITTQPKKVSVSEGETAKITVKATGTGLTYKWYYKKPGASKFYASSSFTKGTYYVKEMDASKSGWKAYCIITDTYGNSVQTNTVTLNMTVPAPDAPVLKTTASVTGTSIKISWSKVSNATGYNIYRRASVNDSWEKIGSTTGTSYTDKTASGAYYYRATAYTTVGGTKYESAQSASIRCRTLSKLKEVTVTPTVSEGYNTIRWKTVTGATGYQIYYKGYNEDTYELEWIKLITVGKVSSYTHSIDYDFGRDYKVRPIYKNNGVTSYGSYVESTLVFGNIGVTDWEGWRYVVPRTEDNLEVFEIGFYDKGESYRNPLIYESYNALVERTGMSMEEVEANWESDHIVYNGKKYGFLGWNPSYGMETLSYTEDGDIVTIVCERPIWVEEEDHSYVDGYTTQTAVLEKTGNAEYTVISGDLIPIGTKMTPMV